MTLARRGLQSCLPRPVADPTTSSSAPFARGGPPRPGPTPVPFSVINVLFWKRRTALLFIIFKLFYLISKYFPPTRPVSGNRDGATWSPWNESRWCPLAPNKK